MFEVGEKVEHVLTKEWCLVIGFENEWVFCRLKNYKIESFHEFELKKI